MKKYFFTGLITALPLVVTTVIVFFLINFLTHPFEQVTQELLIHLGLKERFPYLLSILSKGLILLALSLFLLLLGYFASAYLMHRLISWFESWIDQVPIVGTFYRAIQEMVISLFSSDVKTFSQAVLVPFPFKTSESIGFVSRDITFPCLKNGEHRTAVFVPGTPNPSMGFLLMYPKSQIKPLDIKVDEALRVVVSCGVLTGRL